MPSGLPETQILKIIIASHQDVTKIKGIKLCCNLFTISDLPMYAKHLVTCIFTNKMKLFHTAPSDLEINSDKKKS